MPDYLQVGGARIEFKEALAFAGRYLSNKGGAWAYPAYDEYPGHPGPSLGRADLLAPALLHAHHHPIESYYGVQSLLPVLNGRLADPALTGTLATAEERTIKALVRLFGVLDEYPTRQISLIKLSKVLHRKRPELIPLYDTNIWTCYVEKGPIPRSRKRSWQEFAELFIPALRQDLINQMDQWKEIAALAPGPAITPLPALDIIGWHVGGQKPGSDAADVEDLEH